MYYKKPCREKLSRLFDWIEFLTYKLAVLQVLVLQIDVIRICRGLSVMRLEFNAKSQITTDPNALHISAPVQTQKFVNHMALKVRKKH
jgi:hypothetical protein